MVDPPMEMRANPRAMEAWENASERDRVRTVKSVASEVEAALAASEDLSVDLVESTVDPEEVENVPRKAGQSWNVTAMRAVAALLRKWGWTVVEMPGWETRGDSTIELRAQYIIPHHTAAAVDVDRILRDGRTDLIGPLCNFALHLDGTIVLVAAGEANHAGVASIPSRLGWGIEATGPVPVSARGTSAFPNYRAYIALCVAIRIVEGWGVEKIRAHKEIALPDGRKPDPAFGSVYPAPYADMDRFRDACRVTEVLRNPPAPTPAPTPPFPKEFEMLPMVRVLAPESAQRMYYPATGRMVAIANQAELQGLAVIAKAAAGLAPTAPLPTVTVTKEYMTALVAFSARLEGADDAGVVAAIRDLKTGLLAELNEDDVPEQPPVTPAG